MIYTSICRLGGAEIQANLHLESDNGEGELQYIHPITGQKCQHPEQALQGWSEQSGAENMEWSKLIECISKDDELIRKIADGIKVIEYYAN